MPATANPIIPPFLEKGDTIGLAAPAGPVMREEDFTAGVRLIKEMGFQVKHRRDPMRRNDYLAGSDTERAGELHDLWRDPQVKAILAVRGGYGCLRLLPHLDFDLIAQNRKLLIGFSDLTVLLNLVAQRTGQVTMHGPMLTTLARSDRASLEHFFNTVTGRAEPAIKAKGLEILRPGTTKGRLVGGNLATLTHLLGTPHAPEWQGSILLLEDIGEAPYRIDRMLTHLATADVFTKLNGIILGDFSECGDIEQIWQRTLDLSEKNSIPVWANFPAGHASRNLTLPLGQAVEMNGSTGILHLQ